MSTNTKQKNASALARQISELQAENEHLKQENRLIMEVLVLAGYEWRNQLTLLTLAGDKLKRGGPGRLTTAQASAVERIWDGIAAMRRIATNYLSFARVEDAIFKIQPAFINVKRDILLPVRALYADLLIRHKQKCAIETGRKDILIWADPSLLMSVWENLLNIAIGYGRPGSQIVMSVVERGAEDEFAVRCSGTSISQEYLDELLGSYMSDAKHITDASSDAGLYLAWKIVKAHGGHLWADAQPGKWLSFNFTLPKHRAT